MDILMLLIPVSLVFFVVAIRLFFWAVDDGQFDDPDGAAHSILFDNDRMVPPAGQTITNGEEGSKGKKGGSDE